MARLLPELLWERAKPIGTEESLDNVKRPGFYYVIDPPGLDAGEYHMLVLAGNTRSNEEVNIKQIFYKVGTNEEFAREYGGSAWGVASASGGGGGGGGSTPSATSVSADDPQLISSTFQFDELALHNKGITHVFSGTRTAGTHATFQKATSYPHQIMRTSATIGDIAGSRTDRTYFTRETGFMTRTRISIEPFSTAPDFFFGLGLYSSATIFSDGHPEQSGNLIGIGYRSGVDADMMVYHSDSLTGTVSKTPLVGIGYDSEGFYDLTITAFPGSSEMVVKVINLRSLVESEVTITTDLPSLGAVLTFHNFISNGLIGEVVGMRQHGLTGLYGPVNILSEGPSG